MLLHIFWNSRNVFPIPSYRCQVWSWRINLHELYFRLWYSLCIYSIRHIYKINLYRIVQAWIFAFLTSALDWGEFSVSRPGCFVCGKEPWYRFYRKLAGTVHAQGRMARKSVLGTASTIYQDRGSSISSFEDFINFKCNFPRSTVQWSSGLLGRYRIR
jgi:hypothetical protein